MHPTLALLDQLIATLKQTVEIEKAMRVAILNHDYIALAALADAMDALNEA